MKTVRKISCCLLCGCVLLLCACQPVPEKLIVQSSSATAAGETPESGTLAELRAALGDTLDGSASVEPVAAGEAFTILCEDTPILWPETDSVKEILYTLIDPLDFYAEACERIGGFSLSDADSYTETEELILSTKGKSGFDYGKEEKCIGGYFPDTPTQPFSVISYLGEHQTLSGVTIYNASSFTCLTETDWQALTEAQAKQLAKNRSLNFVPVADEVPVFSGSLSIMWESFGPWSTGLLMKNGEVSYCYAVFPSITTGEEVTLLSPQRALEIITEKRTSFYVLSMQNLVKTDGEVKATGVELVRIPIKGDKGYELRPYWIFFLDKSGGNPYAHAIFVSAIDGNVGPQA